MSGERRTLNVQHRTSKSEREHVRDIAALPRRRASITLSMMLDWTSCPAVERSPEKVSGAWVFSGTRVPVKALFENLEDGATIDQFLEWFPGVTREQALAVLEFAEASLATV
jgi:uncharacterized protein (DUF433 family)